MIFHPDNLGREVTIKGVVETISYIRKDKQKFRIKSEEQSPVVNDYGVEAIDFAELLTMSFDNGNNWNDLPKYTRNKK